MTLSGTRDFQFEAFSDLTAKISYLLKRTALENNKIREIEHLVTAKKLNDERIFEPKIEDPLDNVFEIIDLPDAELKKSMFLYVEPTVQTE